MIKVGIFFGGPSREREISFAGGRTVYDNLDKTLFKPIPIFIDSLGNFILLQWQYLYQGTIRDFYPHRDSVSEGDFSVYIESLGILPPTKLEQLISRVGQHIMPEQFTTLFDVAFLALHGPYGEDGTLQGLLEWYQVPYTGTGLLGNSLGINKIVQKPLMQQAGLEVPRYRVLASTTWQATKDKATIFQDMIAAVGLPMVIKSASQGSSIGVSIVAAHALDQFINAVHRSFFLQEVHPDTWTSLSQKDKQQFLRTLIDLREGIGMPVVVEGNVIAHPEDLLRYLDHHCRNRRIPIQLHSLRGEQEILCEAYIAGREFSCIVLEDTPGHPMALPPTEMIKGKALLDYRAKYMPGTVRKVTPMSLPMEKLNEIRALCVRLFQALNFQVYARIDGFLTPRHEIYLNDPNTTSGMHPASFLFHQAAEVSLNPTQLLTCIIRSSLMARIRTYPVRTCLSQWVHSLAPSQHPVRTARKKLRVGVIMGGFSAERHVSVESGRNIFEKLAASTAYTPIPIFLAGTPDAHRLFILPIHILLKDNADDIHTKLLQPMDLQPSNFSRVIWEESAKYLHHAVLPQDLQPEELTYATLAERIDFAFITVHGRPGEDGTLQRHLEQQGMPYNGAGAQSMQRTIDKFATNQFLRVQGKGIHVAEQALMSYQQWQENTIAAVRMLETQFEYPFIAKPVDEGCSAAVIKINNQAMLVAYAAATFRETPSLPAAVEETLGIRTNTEFPRGSKFLVESLITQGDAAHFLEITGGFLTRLDEKLQRTYEIFAPSEVLATREVLSLEEKFLVGEGQNITPAQFHPDVAVNQRITHKVQQDLLHVAQLLDVEGYGRIDAFVKVFHADHVETWIIEVNPLPGMTPATCIFHQCALHGYTPLQFIQEIIQYGFQKHQKR